MCGRLNVIDDPAVKDLCKILGVGDFSNQINSRFIRATNEVSIIKESDGIRKLEPAAWWLLLDKTENGFKPSKYTSFNTRYDKLNVPRSAGYKAYRESRCIIPVKGFGETEFKNKKPVHYFDFEAVDGKALAMGGLFREWFNSDTGEVKQSCSVITLPPHEKLKNIHSKAMPLILPQDLGVMNSWLDRNNSNTDMFQFLLEPHIPQDLKAYQIDKPSSFNKVGESFLINQD